MKTEAQAYAEARRIEQLTELLFVIGDPRHVLLAPELPVRILREPVTYPALASGTAPDPAAGGSAKAAHSLT